MRCTLGLKWSVFISLVLIVSVPFVLLLGAATAYSRFLYEQEVRSEIESALQRVVTAFDRRLYIEHDLIKGLSGTSAVQGYLPVLLDLKRYGQAPDFVDRTHQVASFFETFQGVRRSLGTVRILDHQGNTLVKVAKGHRAPPLAGKATVVPVVEEGVEDAQLQKALSELQSQEVGSLSPLFDIARSDAVFHTVLPLRYEDERVGYLVIEAPLEALDRSLDSMARPREADLIVAEVNSDLGEREGMVLYEGRSGINFAFEGNRPLLSESYPRLAEIAGMDESDRLQEADGSTLYYANVFPYPDRLVNWVFIFRLDSGYLGRPFRLAVPMLWITLALALLIALAMAFLGTRRITTPVSALTRRLVAFAAGQRGEALTPSGPREIRQACEAFNSMSEGLQQAEQARESAERSLVQNAKLASVGQLAAGIGHELSNPLNNIYSLTRLAQRHLNPDEAAWQDLGQIREEAERASGIIKGLLNFARQGPTSPSSFDLGDWARDSLALVERLAEKHQVSLVSQPGERCTLEADRSLLQQALVNVLINGVQATPAGGEVRLGWQVENGQVDIQILDQGPGLDPASLDHLFDPFYTSKPEGEGTGLGLSIALGICQRHGGELTLVNHSEGGALACLHLPLSH